MDKTMDMTWRLRIYEDICVGISSPQNRILTALVSRCTWKRRSDCMDTLEERGHGPVSYLAAWQELIRWLWHHPYEFCQKALLGLYGEDHTGIPAP